MGGPVSVLYVLGHCWLHYFYINFDYYWDFCTHEQFPFVFPGMFYFWLHLLFIFSRMIWNSYSPFVVYLYTFVCHTAQLSMGGAIYINSLFLIKQNWFLYDTLSGINKNCLLSSLSCRSRTLSVVLSFLWSEVHDRWKGCENGAWLSLGTTYFEWQAVLSLLRFG
jgi:hypothetical protein